MAYKICSGVIVMLLMAAMSIGSAKADIVLLDEYWTSEITIWDVNVTEIDTEQTKDPTQAKSGVWSVQLQNDSGSPNVRFRAASSIMLSEIPPGNSEAKVWYRTDKWDGKYRLEIWLYDESIGPIPDKVLVASLDGGGKDGNLIADDKWHQAKGILQKTGAYDKAPKDSHLATFVWFQPEGGWDVKHRTYLDRLEVVTMGDSSIGKPMPNPIKRVRPNPGAQTTGEGWIWWEGEDAIQHNFPPGGAYVINDEDEQKNFSNGTWLQYHGAEGFKATWQVNIPEAGEYDFWCRGSFDAPPGISCFKWRWGNNDWWVCERDMEPMDVFAVREWMTDYWVHLGSVWLPTGLQTLEIAGLPKSMAFAFDCWLLTQNAFIPNGANKPDSKSQQTIGKEEKTGMKEDKKLIIDNVDRYRVMEACFEGVRVIMSYRGEKYSPEYIQGISGAAFRIAGICPCAPTCSWMMSTQDLVKLLGYEVDYMPLNQKGTDKKTLVNDIITQVKEEISAGRPALVWNAFTNAEWDVVCGFDDEKKQFIGRGSYAGLDGYATADENRMTEFDPALGAILIKDKVGEFNTKEAELASLKEAVKHAHTIKEIPADAKWTFLEGLQCYDRWVNDFTLDPSKKRSSGDSYCLGIYRSTHRAASGFMKELVPKYPEAKQNLEKASEYFIAEANTLDQCDSLIGWNTPEGPDADRNAKTAKLLKQARDNYAAGIGQIELALKMIEVR